MILSGIWGRLFLTNQLVIKHEVPTDRIGGCFLCGLDCLLGYSLQNFVWIESKMGSWQENRTMELGCPVVRGELRSQGYPYSHYIPYSMGSQGATWSFPTIYGDLLANLFLYKLRTENSSGNLEFPGREAGTMEVFRQILVVVTAFG